MNNYCFIINLESSGKCVESIFFRGLKLPSQKQQLKKYWNFDTINVYPIGFTNKRISFLRTHPLNDHLQRTITDKSYKAKVLFIIDNDGHITSIDEDSRQRKFNEIKEEMLKIIKKKHCKNFEFKRILLPKRESFEYITLSIFNHRNKSLRNDKNKEDIYKKILQEKSENATTTKNISLNKYKDLLISKGDDLINFLRETNKKKFDSEKELLESLKDNLFRDREYLSCRSNVKKINNNCETYHYFFDWWTH